MNEEKKEVILSNEEKLTLENFSLKQELINLKFNELNAEALKLREENSKLVELIALKNEIVLEGKKVSLNGNILTIE